MKELDEFEGDEEEDISINNCMLNSKFYFSIVKKAETDGN